MAVLRNVKERTCRTCKWLSDEFTSVCFNAESRYVADFVELDKSHVGCGKRRLMQARKKENKPMAQYHVGCGIDGIYAGTLKKSGDEAINAVVQYMYTKIPEDENSFAYGFKMRDGKYVRLKIEASEKCPDWAKELEKQNPI